MAPCERPRRDDSNDALVEPLLSQDEGCYYPPSDDTSISDDMSESNASAFPSANSSRNITIILWYTFAMFAGRSIWNQNVLATFAFLLRDGDPKAVGFLTAAMGTSQLLVSFPAGYLSDKYRRDTILKVSSGIGVGAVLASLFALQQADFMWLLLSLCVWGVYWGCAETSLAALFADSIPDGQRSHYLTTRSILIKIGQLTGPVVALPMFVVLGDQWTIHDCSIVMTAGQLICLPAVFLLCLLNDDAKPLGNEDTSSMLEEPLLPEEDEEQARGCPSSADTLETSSESQGSSSLNSDCDETYDDVKLGEMFSFVNQDRIIPTLVAVADVTSGLASGMSIRYFAIFMMDNLHIGPVLVQVLYIVAPLLQTVLMKLSQILARRGGRCLVAVTCKWIGIILMLAMVVSYVRRWPVWITCTILVWRTAVMNTPSALTRSIVMDHVPSAERAKWSALESLNMFSWSGSAVIGGILVDKEGIVFNFCATAALQFVATIPLVILSCYRKRRSIESS